MRRWHCPQGGIVECCRYNSLPGQRGQVTEVAYSQIGDLISINLFWGKNPSVMGEWRNRSSWRDWRPQSSTGIWPVGTAAGQSHQSATGFTCLLWLPGTWELWHDSHISLSVTDAAFLKDETYFSFLILQSFKCGVVFLVLFCFSPGGIFRQYLTLVILISLKAEIDTQILKLELFRKGCQSFDAVVYSPSLWSAACYFHDEILHFYEYLLKMEKILNK